ncbi:unnamed protein product [Oncorhynchus mykiss]|uniref:Alpha-1,3-mannosyl-glycoprotein 4-beta-N-acetylglucosaminyltransferase A n=1 Tax=Oncorhynchus mykiss TaxID=8022 RepID=A0A060ZIF6_ONCMY|nr:unnamed protein product [Oncorhynchus mykiss]
MLCLPLSISLSIPQPPALPVSLPPLSPPPLSPHRSLLSLLLSGKMFQAPDLNLIVEFILMFYKEKPIDWLLDHILWVKVCNPEKDAKHCERQKSSLRVRFRPSLFQHVGLHSSLAGKIQKLTDKDFLKPLLHKIHVNPPAEVSTSLKVYQGHTLEKTYLGEDFFWAINPTAGDYVLFKFDKPINIER